MLVKINSNSIPSMTKLFPNCSEYVNRWRLASPKRKKMCQKFAKHSNYAHNSPISYNHKYPNMMKMKPLITAISIAIVSASVSVVAAPTDTTRTLPVRKADSMPTISQPSIVKKVSLDVQENRSSSLDGGTATSTPTANKAQAKPADRMTQLIDA